MPEDTPQIRTTPSPFDSDPDADIILRSSDRVDFHVHKLILSKASTFFRDMFTLPLTSTSHLRDSESQTDLPVMEVTEPSSTLDLLLRMCYPVVPRASVNIDNAWILLEASRKYAMEAVRESIGEVLSVQQVVDAQPLRVYALACGYDFPQLAQAAARSSLRSPISTNSDRSYVDEFRCMTGGAYHRLVQYRDRCGAVASALVNAVPPRPCRDLEWAWKDSVPQFCFFDTCAKECGRSQTPRNDVVTVRYALDDHADWISIIECPDTCFVEYLDRAGTALTSRPYGPVVSTLSMPAPAMKSATLCYICGPSFIADMVRFAEMLEKKVEEKVSEVELAFEQ